jgi:acetyl-CoA carboxylase carboxyl transferase subunit alpha
MPLSFLEFEQPIAELEAKIDELRFVSSDAEVNVGEEIARLRARSRALTTSIFAGLSPWQVAQLARHPQRPYTLDYAAAIFEEFQEIHGDRMYSDDQAIVGGFARLGGRPIMLIGHQKGRDTKERVRRNYGMPKPEGYRKALRLMKLAERFRLPVITLVDTPGAYPGIGSEERNQSEAIARNLFEMARLRVPVITAVIGEGGSGGALAIGVCDRLIMLQYSVYSVISPEGCASILWKSADKKELAAEAMGITADRLAKLGLVDEVLKEPLGGAHRDPQAMADSLKEALLRHLGEVAAWPEEELVTRRYARLRAQGVYYSAA